MAKKEVVRFYRGKNPSIVWDVRKDRQLCSLEKGTLTTDDPYTIGELRKIGYEEIDLDATSPPVLNEEIQVGEVNVKPIPEGLTEAGAAKLQQEDEQGPAVDPPTPTKKKKPAKKKSTTAKKTKKTSTRKPIKRRDKK